MGRRPHLYLQRNDECDGIEEEEVVDMQVLIQKRRQSLPIYQVKKELTEAVLDNQFLVVVGDAGSGKTTQITQYLDEAGYNNNSNTNTGSGSIIGCTQPNCESAITVATRVAEEYNCQLGEQVGYATRFDHCTSSHTLIKYMPEDVLLRELAMDENLSQYSVIVLDEAHERTLHMDILFGVLKQLLLVKRRHDLRLIIISAFLDGYAEKFSKYFLNCTIFTVPPAVPPYPVQIVHLKHSDDISDFCFALLTEALEIHRKEPDGDILLFFPSYDDIEYACQLLSQGLKKLGRMF